MNGKQFKFRYTFRNIRHIGTLREPGLSGIEISRQIKHEAVSAGCSLTVTSGRRTDGVIERIQIEDGISSQLLQVIHTLAFLRLFPGLVQRRQQHCGQNRDDGNNNQQFNQGEIPEAVRDNAFFHFIRSFLFHSQREIAASFGFCYIFY
ncbi:hypothetical protein C5Q97_12125 [Victivallales bacterium CCUG 44730]|nr:hypothetical protein C5Q97_12125 [Victivallales bacterium CCUG 44730]